jgi:NAD(P)-dependent dehydrogenase (short-subunit alcohol dehydrogenase family)
MTELAEDVAIVSGAGNGVGRGLAFELARRGAAVVVTDIDDSAGLLTQTAIREFGGRATYVHADVREIDEMRSVTSEAAEAYGPVTIAVTNVRAGSGGGRIWEHDAADARLIFEVLVFGAFTTIQAFAPALISAAESGRPARLLVVGSEHSLGVPPHVPPASAYTTAKYASLGLVDTARRDMEGLGVTTTLLAPSWVRTEAVMGLVRSSPELAGIIEPYAQDTDEVARLAIDGLLAGEYIVATNPIVRAFAIAHAREVTAAVQMLPAPQFEGHDHDGSGD